MPGCCEQALAKLERAEERLRSLELRDFDSLARAVAERGAAIREIGDLAARRSDPISPSPLELLKKSVLAGAALHSRLQVERTSLREGMLSSQKDRSVSRALVPARAGSGRRLRCSG
jgi:hypothetical protein